MSGVFTSTGTFSTTATGTGTNATPPQLLRSKPLVVIATVAVVALLWYGKVLFVTFFFALFLSFALHPFVELLERIKVPRAIAVSLVLGVLGALLVFFVVNALDQIQSFFQDLPSYETRLRKLLARAQGFLAEVEARTKRLLPDKDSGARAVKLEESPYSAFQRFALQLKTVLSILLYTAAIPILSFFMLKDREKYSGALARILRLKGGRAATDFATGVARVLSGYILGELFVVLITACITTAGLLVLRVPYSYILGPLAGLSVLVPYVGVAFSTTPALLVAAVATDDPTLALKVLVFYSIVQFLEGNVLTPFIVGGRVKLHPLAVMIAFLFWGILWGVPGAILAVPLTATIKVVAERFERFAPWAALLGEKTPDPET